MNPAPSLNACDFRVGAYLNMRTVKNKKIFNNLTEEGAG